MKRRILITGAQGFLGRYSVAHWLEASPEAVILGIGRSPEDRRFFSHSLELDGKRLRAPLPEEMRGLLARSDRYRYQAVDLLDEAALYAALQEFRPDLILHLAGSLRDQPVPELYRLNVMATESLLRAVSAAELTTCRLVLASSGGIYGRQETVPIPESAAPEPIDPYSASKRAAEDLSRILVRNLGLDAVWARIFNIVGPGESQRHLCGRVAFELTPPKAAPGVLVMGNLDPTRDFIDVRDVARGLEVLAEKGESGQPYNLGSGIETPVRGAIGELIRAAGLEGQIEVRSGPGRSADIPRHFADLGALGELGFAPRIPLRESLRELVDYAREVRSLEAQGRGLSAEEIAAPTMDSPLRVSAPRPATYSVRVESGLLRRLPGLLQERYPGRRWIVVTDERVQELYGKKFLRALRAADGEAGVIVLPQGEPSKAWDPLRKVLEELHRLRCDRRALVINLGGGMVSDVGGFAAAIYLRGIEYINVPTTLLAQHDAAVGGKVAVNMPWAKNFVGAFHHPSGVYSDPEVLETLSDREVAAGIAESIKVAMTGDRRLFEILEEHPEALLRDRDPEWLREVVLRSTAQKIALLDPDPYELDLRRALNLGHTFGHPLEVEMAYAGLLHGEAVAFGIALATAVAVARGVCSEEDGERIYALLRAYGLPPEIPRDRLQRALQRVQEIRLVRANQLHFVLPTGIDSVVIVPEVTDEEMADALRELEGRFDQGVFLAASS